MSAAVIVMRPPRRRVLTPKTKTPLAGRERLRTLRRAAKCWRSISTAYPMQALAIAHALGGLQRLCEVWDSEEGKALEMAAWALGNVPMQYAPRLSHQPAEVFDLAAHRARRAAGAP